MTEDPIELVRGSSNPFADFGYHNANVEQLKATLAANIIGVLDDRALTAPQAERITGMAAAQFSCIREASLDAFTIDKLMQILEQLDQHVEIRLKIEPRGVNTVQPLQLPT